MFRGRDGASLQRLFKDSLLSHYQALLGNFQANCIVPNIFYTIITYAMDFAGENPTLELHSSEILYLFEYYM
jgi:hypothetical protein